MSHVFLQAQHQQTLQGKFLVQVDEVVNIAAGFKDRSVCLRAAGFSFNFWEGKTQAEHTVLVHNHSSSDFAVALHTVCTVSPNQQQGEVVLFCLICLKLSVHQPSAHGVPVGLLRSVQPAAAEVQASLWLCVLLLGTMSRAATTDASSCSSQTVSLQKIFGIGGVLGLRVPTSSSVTAGSVTMAASPLRPAAVYSKDSSLWGRAIVYTMALPACVLLLFRCPATGWHGVPSHPSPGCAYACWHQAAADQPSSAAGHAAAAEGECCDIGWHGESTEPHQTDPLPASTVHVSSILWRP